MTSAIRRSLLFVPGSRPERFDKAAAAGADMVCIDLEDACPPDQKAEARDAALNWIASYGGPTLPVLRINSLRTVFGLKDLNVLADQQAADGLTLMLPKVESPEDVVIVDELLQNPSFRFIALVESARGIEAASEIARASDRLIGLMLGGADLAAELRSEMSWDALFYARSKLAFAASRTQLDLIDVPWLDVKDQAGLENETLRVAAMGFSCKAAIHPAQVEPINACLSPSAEEIARARKIVDACAASSDGALLVDGKLVDRPVLLAAQRIVAFADARSE